jgi:hypothetical protein
MKTMDIATFRETVRARLEWWGMTDVDAIVSKCAEEIAQDHEEAVNRCGDLKEAAHTTAAVIHVRVFSDAPTFLDAPN